MIVSRLSPFFTSARIRVSLPAVAFTSNVASYGSLGISTGSSLVGRPSTTKTKPRPTPPVTFAVIVVAAASTRLVPSAGATDDDSSIIAALLPSTLTTVRPLFTPATMAAAREAFAGSEVARATLGDEVVDHYVNMADVELASYNATVTDWERKRGFERL